MITLITSASSDVLLTQPQDSGDGKLPGSSFQLDKGLWASQCYLWGGLHYFKWIPKWSPSPSTAPSTDQKTDKAYSCYGTHGTRRRKMQTLVLVSSVDKYAVLKGEATTCGRHVILPRMWIQFKIVSWSTPLAESFACLDHQTYSLEKTSTWHFFDDFYH